LFFHKKRRLRQRTNTKNCFFIKKGACGNVPTPKTIFSQKRRLRQHAKTRNLFFKTEKQNRFRFRAGVKGGLDPSAQSHDIAADLRVLRSHDVTTPREKQTLHSGTNGKGLARKALLSAPILSESHQGCGDDAPNLLGIP
jgi:hypothetical protein